MDMIYGLLKQLLINFVLCLNEKFIQLNESAQKQIFTWQKLSWMLQKNHW